MRPNAPSASASADPGALPSADAADPKAAAEVYFDGGCPICRREIAVYKKMAGDADAPGAPDAADGVRWRDVSAADGAAGVAAPDGRALDRETLLARFHVRRADGSVVSGFPAFLAVWRRIPRLAWAARLLDRQPFLALGDGAYWAFLKLRPLWRRAG